MIKAKLPEIKRHILEYTGSEISETKSERNNSLSQDNISYIFFKNINFRTFQKGKFFSQSIGDT